MPTHVAPPPGYGHRVARATATSQSLSADDPLLTCVEHWPETRYRNYEYDHLVHLWNRCPVPAVCDVSSDVTPKPVRVQIAPREHIEVLIFRGPRVRESKPQVVCRGGT